LDVVYDEGILYSVDELLSGDWVCLVEYVGSWGGLDIGLVLCVVVFVMKLLLGVWVFVKLVVVYELGDFGVDVWL